MALIKYLGLRLSNPKNFYERKTTESISKFELIEPIKLLHRIKSAEKYYNTDLSISYLKVNRRVGRHCEAEAKLKLIIHQYDVTNKKPSISEIVDCFANCGAEIFVCTYDDGITPKKENSNGCVKEDFKVAEKYYVIDTDMECEQKKEVSTQQLDVNLTLKMSSWDYFLDRKPYCKVYLNKRLGIDVMQGIVDKYKKDNKQEWNIDISGIQNICFEKSQPKKSEEKKSEEIVRVELTQPYLVQFNETEYQFLLRNANRCGEFLFFENGKLNYGLNKNANGKAVVNAKLDDYDSVKSLDNKSQFDQKNEYFMRNGCNYGDFRKPDSVKKERPFVAEYANDEYFRPIKKDDYDAYYEEYSGSENMDVTGLKNKSDYRKEKWKHLAWKLVDVVLSHQDTMGKMVEDAIALGMDIYGFQQRRIADDNNRNYENKYFKKDAIDKAGSQYSKEAEFFSQFSELYTDEELCDKYGTRKGKYENKNKLSVKLSSRPSTDLFFRMEENERTVASSQYRLIYSGLVQAELGEILQLKSISSQKFVVVDVQSENGLKDNKWINKTIVTVVPGIDNGGVKFYPLPAEVEMVRKSGPQTACVVDNADPLFQGRVRIKYYWQQNYDKVEDASPWVRVSYPYATKGSGIYSKLTVGDEVMVNYVNDNIELPYVSGAVYGMDNKVPFNTRTYSQVIRSSNGHMIGVTEGLSSNNLWSGILPVFPVLKLIFTKTGIDKPSNGDFLKKLVGGVVIRDTYGFYQIKASSDERKISISSPYGDVTIDAFTGITLSAPNGDINIKGKNVNIVANNNLKLKSGENIEELLVAKRKDDSLLPTPKKILRKAEDKIWSKFLDVSYLRNIFETFVRPVEGTLEIKSNRYLILNSGKGNATVPVSAYSKTSGVEACEKSIYDKINEVTYWQRDCADVLLNYYHELHEKRQKVFFDFIYWQNHSVCIKSRHSTFAEKQLRKNGKNIDQFALNVMINDYMKETGTLEIPDDMLETKNNLKSLKNEYKYFWSVADESKCFAAQAEENKHRGVFYRNMAKLILNDDDKNDALKLFTNSKEGFLLKPILLKPKPDKAAISKLMRQEISRVVTEVMKKYGISLVSSGDDKTWQTNVDKFITGLQQKVNDSKKETWGYMPEDKYLFKSLKDNTAYRFSTAMDARFAWQQDAMGQILMSQDKGKTLTFNGAVVHENSNSSVEQLRTLLLSPPVSTSFIVGQDSSDGEAKSEAIQKLQKMVDEKLYAQKEEVKAALDKMKPANKQLEISRAIVEEMLNPKKD